MLLTIVVVGIVLPGTVAFVLQAAAAFLRRGSSSFHGPSQPNWDVPLALGLAYFVTHAVMFGVAGLHPGRNVLNLIAWAALLLGVLGAVFNAADRRRFLGTALMAVIGLGMIGAVLWPLRASLGIGPMWGWTLGLGALATALWAGLSPLARRAPGPLVPIALLIGLTAEALLLERAGSAKAAQMLGALTSAVGATMLIALFDKRLTLAGAAAALMVAVAAGLASFGHFHAYSEVPLLAWPLAMASPLGLWVARIPALGRGPRWLPWVAGLLVVAALAGAALLLTHAVVPFVDPFAPKTEYDY